MKNYRFLLVVGISLALAFTFSCSDDKSDGSDGLMACKISNFKGVAGNVVCSEVSLNVLEKENISIEKAKASCINDEGGEFLNNCPTGYVSTCSTEISKIYVYFAIPENKTCEDYKF